MATQSAVARIRSFNRTYTNLIGVLDRHILRSPYSLTEVRILYEVWRAGPRSGQRASGLKAALCVDEGYLSRTIDGLVRRGLLGKSRSAGDGRAFALSVTARGRREIERLNAAADAGIRALIGGLAGAEVDELVRCMGRITSLLDRGEAP